MSITISISLNRNSSILNSAIRGSTVIHSCCVSLESNWMYIIFAYFPNKNSTVQYSIKTVHLFMKKLKQSTKCHGQVFSTPASHSGGPRFKSQPRDGLFWLRFFCCFPQFFQEKARIITQIRPWLLPSTSLPIHYSLIILSFNAKKSELLKESLNKQINIVKLKKNLYIKTWNYCSILEVPYLYEKTRISILCFDLYMDVGIQRTLTPI
jgi:hypothetical protein